MKQSQKILFFFPLLFFIAILVMFTLAEASHAQQAQHPISQLGNCRDARECFYYCEIPRNFPACWSYGKFILHRDVLGEATQSPEEIAKEHGISFPVAELGNCSSPEACMQYCNQPANEPACTDFGEKKGLIHNGTTVDSPSRYEKILSDAKAMFGCDSRQACMAFCDNRANQQICEKFSEKEGLTHHDNQQGQEDGGPQNMPRINADVMESELGCDSQESCMDFCNRPNNYARCEAFAGKYHLNSRQQSQNNQQTQSYPDNMPVPPCTDQQSCMQWCKDNPDKCNKMGSGQNNPDQRYANPTGYFPSISPYPSMGMRQNDSTYYSQQPSNYQPPCTDGASCNMYCQSHQGQCPGFPQNSPNDQFNGYHAPSPYQSAMPEPQPTSGSTQQIQSNSPRPAI